MLSTDTFTRLENLQPAITAKLRKVIQLATEAAEPNLLELCRTYIDAALRNKNWIPPVRDLTEKEQAFIDFTEQFTSSVGTMSDEQVEILLRFGSADEVYSFVNAIYVTDMSLRLELVARRVLA
jgi:hypothetical protein